MNLSIARLIQTCTISGYVELPNMGAAGEFFRYLHHHFSGKTCLHRFAERATRDEHPYIQKQQKATAQAELQLHRPRLASYVPAESCKPHVD